MEQTENAAMTDEQMWSTPERKAQMLLRVVRKNNRFDDSKLVPMLIEAFTLADSQPALLAACEDLMSLQPASYCEFCEQHAPMDDDDKLLGPVPHAEDCVYVMTAAAIAAARPEASDAD